MRLLRHLLPALALALSTPALAASVTVLSAARIHTLDPAQPRAEAMAFDDDGAILALGSRDDLLTRYRDAKRIDAGSATVIPGLIDSHAHVFELGINQLRANLVDTHSKAEALQRLRDYARHLPPGQWLIGYGWDQNDWLDPRFPEARDLDADFPDRPVWLQRIDGHAGWANSAAMRSVGRNLAGDWQPDGGRILRDTQGKPSGIFIDDAMDLLER
ncbi:MAG: amidohydrolase family protein, partial [Lysobacter sp.]